MRRIIYTSFCWGILISSTSLFAQSELMELKEAMTFFASFDQGIHADIASGSKTLHTAASYDKLSEGKPGLNSKKIKWKKNEGKWGGALHFTNKREAVPFYPANYNVAYDTIDWSGTVSFWLSLTPDEDLEPGYCDPLQLTDAAYNDGAVWVDFSNENPRVFRMGVFGDLLVWNPEQEDNHPMFDKRLVAVQNPPFSNDAWTHVVISFEHLNTEKGIATLYLNGEKQGIASNIAEPFTWNVEQARIILGWNYVGKIDELALFDRALSAEEVIRVYELENGLGE